MEVLHLFIYPIKSCKGIPVQSWPTGINGFKYDRHWVLIDSETHGIITQREYPKLVFVEPKLREQEETVEVQAPGMERVLTFSLNSFQTGKNALLEKETRPILTCKIWDDYVSVVDMGDDTAQWFSKYLGKSVRLATKLEHVVRPLDPKYFPPKRTFENVPQTAFADGWPFLILSEASLEDLNTRLERPAEYRNFRPNIVIRGCKPFEEDTWIEICINGHPFYVVNRCTRCVMTTVNPDTGEMNLPTLKTLMSYRRVDAGDPNKACFAMNAFHLESGITINVGDKVEVVETGEHML